MKPQRYSVEFYYSSADICPSDDGDYIKFSDYHSALEKIRSNITFMKGIDASCQAHNAAMRTIEQVLEKLS